MQTYRHQATLGYLLNLSFIPTLHG